jgi:hypothetical protein
MIDRHYGHLAKDGRQHAITLLDAHSRTDIHAVDAKSTRKTGSVDAKWTRKKGSATAGHPKIIP